MGDHENSICGDYERGRESGAIEQEFAFPDSSSRSWLRKPVHLELKRKHVEKRQATESI